MILFLNFKADFLQNSVTKVETKFSMGKVEKEVILDDKSDFMNF